jgi:hypothetical protein
MLADLLFGFIGFALRTAILLGLLWLMLKIQKLDQRFEYRFRGLFWAAVLAGGLDLIPHVGHYLAVPVLLVGVKKVTRADYVDALFSIAIPCALVLGIQLFLLGSLQDHLQPLVKITNPFEAVTRRPGIKTENHTLNLTNPPAPKTNPPAPKIIPPAPKTNPPAPSAPANPIQPDLAKPVEEAVPKTNPPVSVTNPPAPSPPTNLAAPPAAPPAENNSKLFTVRGVTRNGANSAVTVQTGARTYTIFLGEAALMQTSEGPISVRFNDLGEDSVTLEINGEQTKFPIPRP